MTEHRHHWVLIDGFTSAYTCCDCGATRGDRTRPVERLSGPYVRVNGRRRRLPLSHLTGLRRAS